MGLFDFLKKPDINSGVKDFRSTPDAVLLDVRSPQEYRQGHIPGSKNVPLQSMRDVNETVPQLDTPLFVYCYSGARSGQAVNMLDAMGYTNIRNIGGIAAYSGEIEN
jgi:rhodanese-related sulfurtransferase